MAKSTHHITPIAPNSQKLKRQCNSGGTSGAAAVSSTCPASGRPIPSTNTIQTEVLDERLGG